MNCPICEYPHAREWKKVPDRFFRAVGGEFQLYRCSSCGLVFQDEKAVSDRLAEFYPSGYWWEEAGNSGRLERRYREWVVRQDQLKFVLSQVEDAKKYRLLDIGCGSGTFLKLARAAGFDACGLEASEEAGQIARRNGAGTVLIGSVKDLAASGQQFDILTLFHTLEHVPDPFQFLRDTQKLLRRPGKIVIQVPNVRSWQARILGSRWYGLDCPRHIYNYSPFSLLHLLGRAGYRIWGVRHFSLRDNAAAVVSSLIPVLDPMSQRVRLRKRGKAGSSGWGIKEGIYFGLLILAQPLAWLEAAAGRGGTITVCGSLDQPVIPRT